MDGGAWQASVHGVAKSRTRLSDFTFTFHFRALEKEMATHSSVLAWRIPGTGETGGLPSMGSHRVGHNWSDLAATVAGVVNFLGISVKPWSYLKLLHTLWDDHHKSGNHLSPHKVITILLTIYLMLHCILHPHGLFYNLRFVPLNLLSISPPSSFLLASTCLFS